YQTQAKSRCDDTDPNQKIASIVDWLMRVKDHTTSASIHMNPLRARLRSNFDWLQIARDIKRLTVRISILNAPLADRLWKSVALLLVYIFRTDVDFEIETFCKWAS